MPKGVRRDLLPKRCKNPLKTMVPSERIRFEVMLGKSIRSVAPLENQQFAVVIFDEDGSKVLVSTTGNGLKNDLVMLHQLADHITAKWRLDG